MNNDKHLAMLDALESSDVNLTPWETRLLRVDPRRTE